MASSGPLVVLVVGMAGTGKTTLVQRLNHDAVENDRRAYFVNLDPAVSDVPFAANVDIRDTVNYKEVMKQYRLGPNGGIMTSLNLFATRVHQLVELLEQKRDELDVIYVDTPGQIEVFTWSASGQLITEAFASTFPTTLMFVADNTRCVNPQTFMSTMLYSCSMLYKTQLPLTIAFNKADVVGGEGALLWMKDPDALADSVRQHKGYVATLTQSLSLFLHDFYENMHFAVVSAITGDGIDDVLAALQRAKERYYAEFVPALKARQAARQQKVDAQQAQQREQLAADD